MSEKFSVDEAVQHVDKEPDEWTLRVFFIAIPRKGGVAPPFEKAWNQLVFSTWNAAADAASRANRRLDKHMILYEVFTAVVHVPIRPPVETAEEAWNL